MFIGLREQSTQKKVAAGKKSCLPKFLNPKTLESLSYCSWQSEECSVGREEREQIPHCLGICSPTGPPMDICRRRKMHHNTNTDLTWTVQYKLSWCPACIP